MSDDSFWFVPKRYGFGAMPVSWQGWALTIGFALACAATIALSRQRPLVTVAVLIPLVVTFITIAARTTKGGLRWRGGEEE
jgi:hypothetical protein